MILAARSNVATGAGCEPGRSRSRGTVSRAGGRVQLGHGSLARKLFKWLKLKLKDENYLSLFISFISFEGERTWSNG